MSAAKLQAPRGTQDVPPELARRRRALLGLAAELLGRACYEPYETPVFEDTETTFAQLVERCRKTVAYLETLTPEQIDGSEDRTVSWQSRTATKTMQGQPYLLHHVLPNVFFHVTTAYDILRHNGVELGKQDFLGRS